ncbi:hypothetical protein AY606_06040 [Acinetobacter sp. SFB]|uniref:hypothetical protein n=1 Tax=Acinetobacter sp. SFB TaxID=1805634 RepID=UPI0007D8632D|nr:hypothetical protein [Acinetobacter sp. SFB]OAL78985.1 hypothetical protein AY606_06040 [Acinetobacter sp. SFB]
MTNRLEMNWKLDGFVDEQRYYCSETPIDKSSLPAPKAVLAGYARDYVDTDVVANKTYYVRFSSVKNGVEKISGEVQVKASVVDPNFKVKLITQNGVLVDNGYSEFIWTKVGVVNYNENNELAFNQSAYLKSDKIFNFNADFEFEFEFYIASSATDAYFGIVKNTETVWESGGFQISIGGTNVGYESNKLLCGFYGSGSIVSSANIDRNIWTSAKVTRISGVYTLYLNEVRTASGSSNQNPTSGILVVGPSMSTGPIKIRNFKCK